MLIQNIINPEQITDLKVDFQVLTMIRAEDAQQDQILIFNKEARNTFNILTTNNYTEKVRALIKKLEDKGYRSKVFYTTKEGFEIWLQWYKQMEQKEQLQSEKEQSEKSAEGRIAISIMKEIFQTRESKDPGIFIGEFIRMGFQTGASDMHFQPNESGIEVRLRIDGILQSIATFSYPEFGKYLQKIKFMSGVKINITQLPQDGRFSFESNDKDGKLKQIDARVSFMPSLKRESIVIRFLDATKAIDELAEIGLEAEQVMLLEKYIKKTTGIIIISGPTGSGKTTTLYTLLKILNDGKKKIITLEDPIEYKIDGIQQSQMNFAKGYDYEQGLKASLRQDPDIILIGEMRTKETAQIAINASLTGHLVFTTLHTNSVTETVSRLINMEIEPYLLAPALHLLLGQRLVRKSCPHCSEWIDADPATHQELTKAIQHAQTVDPNFGENYHGKILKAKGCEMCNHTGYVGRTALVEILEVDHEIKNTITSNTKGESIAPIAEKKGFLNLYYQGIKKVIAGTTTLEEVHRVEY